jgi:hypothetical protein
MHGGGSDSSELRHADWREDACAYERSLVQPVNVGLVFAEYGRGSAHSCVWAQNARVVRAGDGRGAFDGSAAS